MKPSPLTLVKAQFKSKEALVKAVQTLATDALWLDRLNENKGLERVSNAKLLHMHTVLTDVKAQFGTRDKLIDAIVEAKGRPKDKDYRSSLQTRSTPSLWEAQRSLAKRAKKKSAAQ